MNKQVMINNCLDCNHCYIESDGGFIEVERTWNACKKGKNNVGKFPFFNTKCKSFEKSEKTQRLILSDSLVDSLSDAVNQVSEIVNKW